MDSATISSFIMNQKHINLLRWHYHQYSKGKWYFYTIYDEYHQCTTDFFYNYAAFFREAYNHRFKVLCHGITRKVRHGITPSVIQEDIKSKKGQIGACRRTKATALQKSYRFWRSIFGNGDQTWLILTLLWYMYRHK